MLGFLENPIIDGGSYLDIGLVCTDTAYAYSAQGPGANIL